MKINFAHGRNPSDRVLRQITVKAKDKIPGSVSLWIVQHDYYCSITDGVSGAALRFYCGLPCKARSYVADAIDELRKGKRWLQKRPHRPKDPNKRWCWDAGRSLLRREAALLKSGGKL